MEETEKKEKKPKDWKKIFNKAANSAKTMGKIKISLGVIFAVILVGAIIIVPMVTKKPEKQITVTTSTLEKVVKTSTLSTYETIYNGVTAVHNPEKPERINYYVSYEATVKAGLDFNAIQFSKDDEARVVTVSLPPLTLQNPEIDIEKTDYIIINKKMNKDAITVDGYKAAIEDVRNEATKKDAIYTYAKDNAEKLIEGLLSPFMHQMGGYTIEFEWRDK